MHVPALEELLLELAGPHRMSCVDEHAQRVERHFFGRTDGRPFGDGLDSGIRTGEMKAVLARSALSLRQ